MTGVVLIGLLAGLAAGLLGIGGGSLIVPALVLLAGFGVVEAEATSLLAIVPTAVVGAWRQDRYGNVHGRDGVVVGLLSVAGAAAGVVAANELPERTLELAFAGLLLLVAFRLARGAVRSNSGRAAPS